MNRSVPPPRVHEHHHPAPGLMKSLMDVFAEVDDWYAKEIHSAHPWQMPTELLNLEQKRQIFRIALRHGIWEAALLSLITPFTYGIYTDYMAPLPEIGHWGWMVALITLGWPHLLLPVLPLRFMKKIRGNITAFICRELTIARAIGLVAGAWIMSTAFLYAPGLVEFLFPPGTLLYLPYLKKFLFDTAYLMQESYLLLATSALFSGITPLIAVIFTALNIQKKWEEINELVDGIL